MSTIQSEILEDFYKRLDEVGEVPESMVEALRSLLASGGKLKAEDFVQIFAPPSEEQIP